MHTCWIHTVLPQIMALCAYFFPATFHLGDYMRLAFIIWSSESKFCGRWILMAANNACVADLLYTVYHEMGRMVCGHHVHKSVWSPVIGKQLILEEPANPHNECVVSVIQDYQIVGHILKNYSQITCMVFLRDSVIWSTM